MNRNCSLEKDPTKPPKNWKSTTHNKAGKARTGETGAKCWRFEWPIKTNTAKLACNATRARRKHLRRFWSSFSRVFYIQMRAASTRKLIHGKLMLSSKNKVAFVYSLNSRNCRSMEENTTVSTTWSNAISCFNKGNCPFRPPTLTKTANPQIRIAYITRVAVSINREKLSPSQKTSRW